MSFIEDPKRLKSLNYSLLPTTVALVCTRVSSRLRLPDLHMETVCFAIASGLMMHMLKRNPAALSSFYRVPLEFLF